MARDASSAPGLTARSHRQWRVPTLKAGREGLPTGQPTGGVCAATGWREPHQVHSRTMNGETLQSWVSPVVKYKSCPAGSCGNRTQKSSTMAARSPHPAAQRLTQQLEAPGARPGTTHHHQRENERDRGPCWVVPGGPRARSEARRFSQRDLSKIAQTLTQPAMDRLSAERASDAQGQTPSADLGSQAPLGLGRTSLPALPALLQPAEPPHLGVRKRLQHPDRPQGVLKGIPNRVQERIPTSAMPTSNN